MVRRAKLYARINGGNGSFSRVAVKFDGNGRALEPKPRKGAVTSYAVRVAGKFEHAGEDLHNAVTFLRQRQAMIGSGVSTSAAARLPSVMEPTAAVPGRVRLIDAAEEYKNTLRVLDKSKSTISVYSLAIDSFIASCSKTYIDEIDRKDILNFVQWMRDNLQVRIKGTQNRTIKNKIGYLTYFLNKYGVKMWKGRGASASAPGLLFNDDMPKHVKRKPKKYDQETLDRLFQAANIEEKDYLMFLLWSGFRDEEVQFLLYSDFDWKGQTVSVHTKPQFNWKPKDYEERTVTLPSEVVKQIKERMTRTNRKATDLVFPSDNGKPCRHLIYRLHTVAEKVGLNLRGKQAGHMFRKTAGSRVAKKLGLRAAMDFLGHSDIETTALYLAADDASSAKSRQAFDEMFQEGD